MSANCRVLALQIQRCFIDRTAFLTEARQANVIHCWLVTSCTLLPPAETQVPGDYKSSRVKPTLHSHVQWRISKRFLVDPLQCTETGTHSKIVQLRPRCCHGCICDTVQYSTVPYHTVYDSYQHSTFLMPWTDVKDRVKAGAGKVVLYCTYFSVFYTYNCLSSLYG